MKFYAEVNAMEPAFSGFAPDAFAFLRGLAHNNNKSWFEVNRARYETYVVGAFRGLLQTMATSLPKLNPHFEVGGRTNRNFSRINRDIRFSKDKSPYKPNYYLYVFDSRRDRATDGRLYVGISAECLTVGFSIYAAWGRGPQGILEAVFRKRVAEHRDIFRRLLDRVVRSKRYETYWHRQEKGEWVQHPGLPRRDEDWQTVQGWIVRRVFLPNARGLITPAFAQRVLGIFTELYPLYVFTSVASPGWQAQLRRSLRT